jgi:hypothetical protein
MKKLLLFVLLLTSIYLHGQKKYTISGYISDASSGEKLIAASVFDTLSFQGTVSNNYGFFSLTLNRGPVVLEVSYLGHQKLVNNLTLNKDVEINFNLESINELETIEIVAAAQSKVENETQMSKIEVPVEQIKKIPALLGEVDVLKTLQLLPGVQSGGEGQSGLYIRGGSPDQNLVLLDGVPVYNVSHLLGIFSVFNADAIKNVTLTKGGFPARYGGRLSSVIEINMKDGHMNEFHGEGSVGLISSRLTLEGPIIKDRTSFLVSARRTYWDVIFAPVLERAASYDDQDFDMDLDLYFYDLNAKINHRFNDNHRLYLSYYSGADVFGTSYTDRYMDYEDKLEAGINWGNFVSSLRWNYRIHNKLFANTTLTYSNYDLTVGSAIEEEYTYEGQYEHSRFEALYISGIRDFGGKIDFDYIPIPNHYIKFGASATHHTYRPGAIAFEFMDTDFELDTIFGNEDDYSMEYDLYVEDDMKFGALKANLGLHASGFSVSEKFYTSLQPRINLRYLLKDDLSIKASFATMTQYLNLLTTEALALPSDLWVPSTDKIKPQESWQAALGVAKSFNNDYEVTLEAYYKGMNNVLSYLPGESFLTDFIDAFGDTEWESKMTQGKGQSYGAELFLQKKKGKTTGWIGYTLSWNWRQFDDINGGKKFPYRYDRRHDISFVISHKFNKKYTLSGTWVYGTGNAVTLPTYKYLYPNVSDGYYYVPYFEGLGEKNNYRMTDYHRLDLSLEIKTTPKWGEGNWIFGVYNAYWHRNPYFLIRDDDYDYMTGESTPAFKEISILPFIPHIAYNFKF